MSTRSKALASARSAYLSCSAHWHGQCCNGSIARSARDRQLFDDRKRNGDHLLTLRGQAEQRSLQVCQYGLSVFEAMKKDLEGTEIELTSARYDVTDAQSDLYFAKKNAETLQDELTSVRAELEETRGRLDEAENELASVKFELSKAKLKLRRKEGEAQLAERCYEDLRKACSETTLDLLRTKRERDDLQSELATARRFARRLLAERNELIAERDELRYQLVEARIGFEFFQGEYIKAGALIADAKEQIKGLESAVEVRDKVIGSLLDDVVIRTKG